MASLPQNTASARRDVMHSETTFSSVVQTQCSDSSERYPHHTTACLRPLFVWLSRGVPIHVTKLQRCRFTQLFEIFKFESVRPEILGHSMGMETSICPYRIDSRHQSSFLKPTLSQSFPFEGEPKFGPRETHEWRNICHNFSINWINWTAILLNAQIQFRRVADNTHGDHSMHETVDIGDIFPRVNTDGASNVYSHPA
jgi:hypothetical protein